MAEIRLHEGESIENALRRFKRKVMQEDIIKEVKKHSFYLKPGEKKRIKQALARKRQPEESASRTPRRAKVVSHRKTSDPRVYCLDGKKNLRWKSLVSNHRN